MTELFVLFVDDSRLCSMVTSEILRDHGFNVLEASDAREAYLAIDGLEPLLALVTDIDLGPGDDGYEIARRARARHPGLPVIYVSGSAADRHISEGVPGSEFIAKPFRKQRIAEALNRVIAVSPGTARPSACAMAAEARLEAQEVEEDRRAVAEFLGLVPGGDMIGWGDSPVVRIPGGPVEQAAGQDPLKGPVGIAGHVRSEA
jgi:CheY-like chemotaxis protein